jgi:hypothetical protein
MSKQKCAPKNQACKIRSERGRGSFAGYKLRICKTHQIIVSMRPS